MAEDAERRFEKLLAVKSDWEDAAFRLGFLQLQRGEYAGAVDSFEVCLNKRRDWVEALINLGLAFWKFEDLDGAAQTFHRVLTLQPANTDALRALTAIAIERKDPRLALELHQKATGLGEPSPELSFNLGLLLQSIGDEAASGAMLSVRAGGQPNPISRRLCSISGALCGRPAGRTKRARPGGKAATADPGLARQYFN